MVNVHDIQIRKVLAFDSYPPLPWLCYAITYTQIPIKPTITVHLLNILCWSVVFETFGIRCGRSTMASKVLQAYDDTFAFQIQANALELGKPRGPTAFRPHSLLNKTSFNLHQVLMHEPKRLKGNTVYLPNKI